MSKKTQIFFDGAKCGKLAFQAAESQKPLLKMCPAKVSHLTVLLSAIWGLKQNEIAVFVGTILTALGIAFFAQWSLLSNVTSSLLLFFNHPVKIGDAIKVLDKDYSFEGEVTDLTYFFVHLKTADGEIITIPNSLFLQKPVSVIEKEKSSKIKR